MSSGEQRAGYLFLSLLQAKVGASVISRLGNVAPEEVIGLPVAKVAERTRMTERARSAMEELRSGFDPDDLLGRLEDAGARAITLADPEYPERLKEIPDPPPALFVRGAIPPGNAVALVGSRKASVTGLDAARRLGRELANREVCVVSGLALGIDAAAHEGAVSAGGPTIGVLGCGIDVIYPKRNRALFERVERGGGIVSEYSLGEAPLAWRFPARNRIIAGLCDHLVVVEAAERSGALITARHALDAGRDVWAAPGPLGAAECRGSNQLLADGAGVLWDVEEFAESVAPAAEPVSREPELPPVNGLPDEEAKVFAGVGFESVGVDVLEQRCGVEVSRLLAALSLLELKGYVTRDSSGRFSRRGAV